NFLYIIGSFSAYTTRQKEYSGGQLAVVGQYSVAAFHIHWRLPSRCSCLGNTGSSNRPCGYYY
ncbi:hypothetical protein A2U01_0066259, partial [Trifolium medium]|nr:hypothetical protein [Trifolium medium]